MKTARQRVYEFIRSHHRVTATDISQGLGMTRANAQHHLQILAEQELIENFGQRKSKEKGRPAYLYGVSTRIHGENYISLVDALLKEITQMRDLEDQKKIFQMIAIRMIENRAKSLEHKNREHQKPITKRLREAIQILNIWQYYAHWEAHRESPHIILGHCPYLSILPSHPELCEIDGVLIEYLIVNPVELLAKRIPDERGIPFCQFRLKSNGKIPM